MKMEFFKKRNSFKKKDFIFNPNLYWKFAIFCSLVLIIFISFFGYYLFVRVNKEFSLPSENTNVQNKMIDEGHLAKVLNIFSQRAQESSSVLGKPVPFVDPSL